MYRVCTGCIRCGARLWEKGKHIQGVPLRVYREAYNQGVPLRVYREVYNQGVPLRVYTGWYMPRVYLSVYNGGICPGCTSVCTTVVYTRV